MTPPAPKTSRTTRHGSARELGDLGDDGRDVAVQGEHAAEADDADTQRQEHLWAPQRSELTADRRLGAARERRDDGQDGGDGDCRQHDDQPVAPTASRTAAPARWPPGTPVSVAAASPSMTELTARPAQVRRHERRRDQGGDPEVGAVRQAGSGSGRPAACGSPGASAVSPLATRKAAIRPTSRARRGSRALSAAMTGAPTTTPSGVRGDDVPGRGDVDAHAVGDVGEQAHGHELRRADGEAPERERHHRHDQPEGAQGRSVGRGGWALTLPAKSPVRRRHSRDGASAHARRAPQPQQVGRGARRRGEPGGSHSRQVCQTATSSRASGSWA